MPAWQVQPLFYRQLFFSNNNLSYFFQNVKALDNTVYEAHEGVINTCFRGGIIFIAKDVFSSYTWYVGLEQGSSKNVLMGCGEKKDVGIREEKKERN